MTIVTQMIAVIAKTSKIDMASARDMVPPRYAGSESKLGLQHLNGHVRMVDDCKLAPARIGYGENHVIVFLGELACLQKRLVLGLSLTHN